MCRHWIVQLSGRMCVCQHLESKCDHLEGGEGSGCGESWWLATGLARHSKGSHEGQAFISYPHAAPNTCFPTVDRLNLKDTPGSTWHKKWDGRVLGLLDKLDLGSSALLEPANPLQHVNIFMQVTVRRESRELIELVLESFPVHSVCIYPLRIPKVYALPASGAPWGALHCSTKLPTGLDRARDGWGGENSWGCSSSMLRFALLLYFFHIGQQLQ